MDCSGQMPCLGRVGESDIVLDSGDSLVKFLCVWLDVYDAAYGGCV